MPARMQGVEIRDTVDTELGSSRPPRRSKGSVGPVVAASGDQAHAVAVALQSQPVAVLYFVEPVGCVGDGGGFGGQTEIKGAGHCGNRWNCSQK
jgi:hypothetical protein